MKLRRTSPDPVVAALEAAGLSRGDAQRLSTSGTSLTMAAGTPLCFEGDVGLEAFVLVSGEAVVRLPESTDRTVAVGEVIGEIAVLDPTRRRTATVETTEDSVVLVFDVRTFRFLAQDMSDVLAPERAA
ncbi:MAG: family transcriptional regulator, cyclic receptor protein [Actinomycetota bacterium]|jgi:CRP-like cAMP-binding protein